jgi:hypothetical protein
MSLLSFFGCGLTAYGPIITLFLLTISNNAQLVILAMTRQVSQVYNTARINTINIVPFSGYFLYYLQRYFGL